MRISCIRRIFLEREVELQFSNEILFEAAKRFNLSTESLKLLGSFENYVYEGDRNSESYILRLTHSSHRSTNMVLGELEWINHLANNGVSVAKPLYSINGKLAEEIFIDNDYFIVSLFEKAKGELLRRSNPEEFNRDLIVEWGKVIGQMHRVTKNFQPSREEFKRPQWHEDELMDFEKYLPVEDKKIVDIGSRLLEYLNKLPMTLDDYGLIHTDVHSGNFFVDEGKITVFDFDDCSYQWFISDIAIALYYTIWWRCNEYSKEDKKAFADYFLDAFMEGYVSENKLEDFWVDEMPYFLKLRDLTLYTVLHKKLDINNLDENYKKLLKDIRGRIIEGVTIV